MFKMAAFKKRTIALALAVLMFGQLLLSIPLPAAAASLFADDFEDGDAAGWSGNAAQWSLVTDGTYRYRGANANNESISVNAFSTNSDMSLEAKIKPLSADTTNGSFGLIARYTDNNNYYLFYYHKPTSVFRILKKQGGTFTVLAQSQASAWADNSERTVKIVLSGTNIELYADNVLQTSVVDSTPFESGKIGMRVNWADATFDDVRVDEYEAPPTTPPEEPVVGDTAHKTVFVYNLAWFTTPGSLNGPNSFLDYEYERNVTRMLNYPLSGQETSGKSEPLALHSPEYDAAIKASAKLQLRQMQRMGADVVVFNMSPNNDFDLAKFDRADWNTYPFHGLGEMGLWLDAAEELGSGMKIAFMPDIFEGNEEDNTETYLDSSQWIDMLETMIDMYKDHPNLYKVDGQPYVSNFGTQRNPMGAAGWQSVYDAVKASSNFFWVPDIGGGISVNAAYAQSWQPGSDASHTFIPGSPADFIVWKVNELDKYFTNPVTWMWRPGYYLLASGTYIEPTFADMHNLYAGVERQPSAGSGVPSGQTAPAGPINNSDANWMGLMSWNDVGEDHDIWPSALKGDVLVQLNQYYTKWFKDGVQPADYDDKIFIMYPDQLGGPTSSDKANPSGKMYYWSVLKQPKTLEIDGFPTIALPAGLQYGEVGTLQRGVHTKPFQAVIKENGVPVRTMDIVPAIDGANRWDERLTYRYQSLIEDARASEDFDMLQGMNNWSYQAWDGNQYTDLSYNAAAAEWVKAGDAGLSVAAGQVSPGESAAAARTWTAPHEGTIQITGSVAKAAGSIGGDGVTAQIWRNGELQMDRTIAYDDTIGYEVDAALSVNQGDRIVFRVDKRADSASDQVVWDPKIAYASNRANTLAAPTRVEALANDGKVKLGWTDVVGADRYRVLRSKNGGAYELVAVADERAYEDFQLENGATYRYVIVPVDEAGQEGTGSSAVEAAPAVWQTDAAGSFAASQGKGGWINAYKSPTDSLFKLTFLTYDKTAGTWSLPGDAKLAIAAETMQPGDSYDAVKKFAPKRNAQIRIAGQVQKLEAGGDGAVLKIVKSGSGRTLLQQIDLSAGDLSEHPVDVTVNVLTTDSIQFELSRGGETANADADGIAFNPVITYIPGDPDAPTGLTASSDGAGVRLAWDEVAGAKYYRVKRSDSEAGPFVAIGNAVKAAGQPIGYTDRDAEAGHTYYYKVTTVVSDGVKWGYGDESSASSNVIAYPEEEAEAPAPAASLTGPSQITAGQSFSLDYALSHLASVAGGVYAQQIDLSFDPAQLSFTAAESLVDGVEVIATNADTAGHVKIIAASLGGEHALSQDGNVLRLTWQALAGGSSTTAVIAVDSVLLSDGTGNEWEAAAAGSTYSVSIATVASIPGDLNGDGQVRIGDLGILAAAYGMTSSSPGWDSVKQADLNRDGVIDITDLVMLALQL